MEEEAKNEIEKIGEAERVICFGEPDKVKPAKCSGVAYSGGPVSQEWAGRVVVDLAGMEIAAQVPIMYNHQYEPGYRLGVAQVEKSDTCLTYSGELDRSTRMGQAMIESGSRWEWQVSIGAENLAMRKVKPGEKRTCNGREVEGPAVIVEKSLLREISLVAIGADPETSMSIVAALQSPIVKPEGETKMAEETKTPEQSADLKATLATMGETIAALNGKIEAMEKREAERSARPAPQVIVARSEATESDVIACALNNALGVENEDVKAAEVASRKFGDGIGIKHAIVMAARMGGWDGEVLTASNLGRAIEHVKAAFSNINIPGILGNAANKRIKDGFAYVEQAWREIADIVSTPDFKTFTTYRLGLDGDFKKIPAGGKFEHGSISEESWKNKVDNYGMMISVTREDIINDDLNAIRKNLFQLGRKAGLALNKAFWTEFLDNSTFFSSAHGNLRTSAGELNLDNLSAAVGAFKLRKHKGELIGGTPSILLVPTSLEIEAQKLFNDAECRTTVSGKTITTGNPHRGKYRPVGSAYLEDSGISGYSADDWYLLDDPAALATIQVAFLDGRQTPVVESSDAEFDTLGIRYRAYMDFGVAKADYCGGLKCDKA